MQEESPGPQIIRFGTFELDLRAGELRKRGAKIRLQEQPLRILEMLLAHPGQLVSREELRSRLWPSDTFVDFDHGLNKAINKLREALGDSAQNPRFIETIPRRGYRFLIDLAVAAAPAPTSLRLALAVLPFMSYGGDPDAESLAEDLNRELTSTLANDLRMTQVVSRDLVAPYKGKSIDPRIVGRELDASYLLEAEVRRGDERVEVNAQIIEATSATQLWNERLETVCPLEEREIALLVTRLTDRVQKVISIATERRFAGPPAPNASPLELTWHAYSIWQTSTVANALEARKCFDQALRLDPNFLLAIQGRWLTLDQERELDPRAAHGLLLREMDELSSRATKIDGSDEFSWRIRAATLVRQHRLNAALEANAHAQKLVGSGALGFGALGLVLNQRAGIMLFMGQPEAALRLVEKQLSLDPQGHEVRGQAMFLRARACMALGRYDETIAACERAVALSNWLLPPWLPHLYLAAAYALKDETTKAAAERTILLELRPSVSIADFKRLHWSDNAAFVQQTEAHLLAGLWKAGIPEQ